MQKTPTQPTDEPARKRRGIIETIGDMIDHEQRMAVYCDNRREYGGGSHNKRDYRRA